MAEGSIRISILPDGQQRQELARQGADYKSLVNSSLASSSANLAEGDKQSGLRGVLPRFGDARGRIRGNAQDRRQE